MADRKAIRQKRSKSRSAHKNVQFQTDLEDFTATEEVEFSTQTVRNQTQLVEIVSATSGDMPAFTKESPETTQSVVTADQALHSKAPVHSEDCVPSEVDERGEGTEKHGVREYHGHEGYQLASSVVEDGVWFDRDHHREEPSLREPKEPSTVQRRMQSHVRQCKVRMPEYCTDMADYSGDDSTSESDSDRSHGTMRTQRTCKNRTTVETDDFHKEKDHKKRVRRCYICQKTGHYKADCPQLFGENQSERPSI